MVNFTKAIIVIIFFLIVIMVNGCSIMRSEKAEQEKHILIGKNKEYILSCMGVPLNKSKEGRIEVWEYHSGGGTDTTSYNYGRTKFNGNFIRNNFFGDTNKYGYTRSHTRLRDCTINIVFENNIVDVVNYSGRSGGLLNKNEQCAYALENC